MRSSVVPRQSVRWQRVSQARAVSTVTVEASSSPNQPAKAVSSLYADATAAGTLVAPRAHLEQLKDGTQVKLGVFLSNTKTRRAKLTTDKLQVLAGLGLEWA